MEPGTTEYQKELFKEALSRSIAATDKADVFRNKMGRARKHYDRYYSLFKHWDGISTRYLDISLRIRRNPHFEFANTARAEMDFKGTARRKEEKKTEFLTRHKFSAWFMSNSLGADYGTFTCDSCGRGFYHSPSTITKAAKVVYNCCCGYCTNSLIGADWNERPYE